MGMVFRRKYRRKDGTVAETATYFIKYYVDGRPKVEPTETASFTKAKRMLQDREGKVAAGEEPAPSTTRKTTFAELAALVVADYRLREHRSVDAVERRLKLHILPAFGAWRAAAIKSDDLTRYKLQRREAGARDGTINRELAVIRRAFRLGLEADPPKVLRVPRIEPVGDEKMAVRQGFFEREQFEAVRAKLAEPLQPLVTFLYVTGWRLREALTLEWRNVDFDAGCVTLDAARSKNKEPRTFYFTPQLRVLLEAQRAHTDAVQRDRQRIVKHVFHRNGKAVSSFYGAWREACKAAGHPGRLIHDLRRTAARNLVRSGVSEPVAQKVTGHKTREIFRRYNIVSGDDLRDAARLLGASDTAPSVADSRGGTSRGTSGACPATGGRVSA